ncbi:MAG TPA: hypothetical protein VGN21_17870 [Stellaceae bacterium]|jgi:hypothetical protein
MLKLAMVAVLLAASTLTSSAARAEEDQHLTGRDDSGAAVGADVAPGTTATLTIVQDPSRTKTTGEGGDCPTQASYLARVTAADAMMRGKTTRLKSCELNKCTNPKLKAKCKGQPDYFKVSCTGSLEYQVTGKIRIELDYDDEYWDTQKCQLHHKKGKTSQVFLLWTPNSTQGDPEESQVRTTLDCYMHNILYPVKDHPMHDDCR